MSQIMGVINLVNEPDQLEQLTNYRCVSSVPFGGRYRLIDFVMSNMVNSGIEKVAVFAHTKYRSLMDHLGSGKEWDLDRKRGGLFILPPAVDETRELMKGDLYNFNRNRDYFERGSEQYVLVTRSHQVCQIDFRPVLEQHISTGADITMIYQEVDSDTFARARRIDVNPDGRVTMIEEYNRSLKQSKKVSMDMFLLRKELLLEIVERSLAQGYDYFVRDGIMKNLQKLKVHGYEFNGHLGIVNTIPSYYYNTMQLLQPEVWKELFLSRNPIFTKVKDEPPAKYNSEALATNSLIANGCVIEGKVQNSVLFRGVKIHKGATVINSIILQGCEIGEHAIIENAILDKDVIIRPGKVLIGDQTAQFVADKRKVI